MIYMASHIILLAVEWSNSNAKERKERREPKSRENFRRQMSIVVEQYIASYIYIYAHFSKAKQKHHTP